jgi:hypothetical protein
MADVTTHAVRVRSLPVAPDPAPVGHAVRRVADLGVGTLALAGSAVVGALDRFWPGAGPTGPPSVAMRVAKAAVGAALVTERRAVELVVVAELVGQQATDVARRTPIVRDVLVGVDAAIDRWGDRAEIETARREQAVRDFVGALVPALIDAVVERVDVAAVVDRVPLADIVGALDVDALLERVDLDEVLAHVDVDGMLQRVDVDALIQRVDVDALIGRVDVDGIVGRVAVDRLMARIDLGPLVTDVLAEVDIGGIVRESTGSITGDAVDSARIGAMRLDTFVGRVADRALLRKRTHSPSPAEPSPPPGPSGPTPEPGP